MRTIATSRLAAKRKAAASKELEEQLTQRITLWKTALDILADCIVEYEEHVGVPWYRRSNKVQLLNWVLAEAEKRCKH